MTEKSLDELAAITKEFNDTLMSHVKHFTHLTGVQITAIEFDFVPHTDLPTGKVDGGFVADVKTSFVTPNGVSITI